MTEPLPSFRYHPDPLGTGSIATSPEACRRCERQRGYIYTGPVYANEELGEAFCPWCIADGSAAQEFDAEFTDSEGVGDYGAWDAVPPEVVDEVTRRTPGFIGWQQERWWTHCADAAEFLGRAGRRELSERWPDAVPVLMAEAGLDGAGWTAYAAELDTEGSPTAYIFRCRHCGQLGGYSDCD
ncbi:MAG: CbrC family protein [Gemmatimonadota bacterium]